MALYRVARKSPLSWHVTWMEATIYVLAENHHEKKKNNVVVVRLNCQVFLTLGWHQASGLETLSCLFVSECSWAGCSFNSRVVKKSLLDSFIVPRCLDKGQMLSEGEVYYCQIWKICSHLVHSLFTQVWTGIGKVPGDLISNYQPHTSTSIFKFGSSFYFLRCGSFLNTWKPRCWETGWRVDFSSEGTPA